MSILTILISIAVFGVVLYLLNLLPMPAGVKQILNVVAVIILVLWLLRVFGVIHYLSNVHV